jgi:hypothetical protein
MFNAAYMACSNFLAHCAALWVQADSVIVCVCVGGGGGRRVQVITAIVMISGNENVLTRSYPCWNPRTFPMPF